MIDFIRSRLSYANVMATVFLALGGVGYAATQLPKNSGRPEAAEGRGHFGDGAQTIPDKGQSVYGFTKSILQFLIQPLSEVIRLSAGQQVTLLAFQDTGATKTSPIPTKTDEGTFLEMT